MSNEELLRKIKNFDINCDVIEALVKLMESKTETYYKDNCPKFIKDNIYIKDEKIKLKSIRCDYSDDGDFSDRKRDVEEWLGRKF